MKKAHVILTLLLMGTLGSARSQTDFTVYSSGELNLMFERHVFSSSDPLEPPTIKRQTYFRGGYQTGFLFKKPIKERYAIRAGLGFTQVHYQSGFAGHFLRGEMDIKEVVQPITGNIVAVSVDYKQVVVPIFLHLRIKETNHGPYIGASIARSFDLNKTYHNMSGAVFPFLRPAGSMLNSLIYYPQKESVTSIIPEIGYSYTWQMTPNHAMVIDPYLKQAFQRRHSDFRRMTTLGLRLAYKPNFTKA